MNIDLTLDETAMVINALVEYSKFIADDLEESKAATELGDKVEDLYITENLRLDKENRKKK
jgi:hypothetical protein